MSKLTVAAFLLTLLIAPAAYAQTSATFDVGAAVNGNAGSMNADGSMKATVTAKPATTTPSKEIEIRTAEDVVTGADLNLYENNISMTNARIIDADSSKSKVAISYEHKGRLLGFIPIMVQTRTTASVAEDGTLMVKTTIPWWNFLVAGTGSVRADVDNELSGSAELLQQVSASEDANARARALDTIAHAHAHAAAGESK